MLPFALSPLPDESLQSSRIAHTHDLLGLDFAQFLPLTQRIGLISQKKADTAATSMSELLHHTTGMLNQIQAVFKKRTDVAQAVQQAEIQVKSATTQLEAIKKKVAAGEKVRGGHTHTHVLMQSFGRSTDHTLCAFLLSCVFSLMSMRSAPSPT